jgi:hypothetical protein
MSQSNPPGNGPTFADEIAKIASTKKVDESTSKRFLTVWNEFAQGLRKSGIGADVRRSDDGTRYHLVLWPAHRPAWRTMMLTFQMVGAEVRIFQQGTTPLKSPEELAEWLRDFASGASFQDTLQALREKEDEPVEARLVVEGAPDLLVLVPKDNQRELAEGAAGDLMLTITLEEGDTTPNPKNIRLLRSAGIEINVASAALHGRTLELTLKKVV